MAYSMYIDGTLMPVMPSSIEVKIKGQNSTIVLISGEEINILKSPGLTEVSFDLILPHAGYPYATGRGSIQTYLSLFERLKTSKQPFQWIVNRSMPNGTPLHYSNLTCALEDYDIEDDADEGFDTKVSLNLKQWKSFGAKTVEIQAPATPAETPKATVEEPPRETSGAPKDTSYTVKKGDCLWNIAKKYLGDGSRYKEIAELNQDKISNPNLIYPGQTLTLPN